MANGALIGLVRQINRIAGRRSADGLTDGELLQRFVSARDETAFAALVRRHGPAVWGVCRRVLGSVHDAEDAFQATFLVLVRKAPSLRAGHLVGNWLYGVACRVAARARASAAWRRAHQQEMPDLPAAGPEDTLTGCDLRPVLDEEVSRLPDRYRAPVI